jgi:hypothetical protein
MTASCSYDTYGQLSTYETPARSATAGPAVVNSRIQSNTTVSQYVTLLGRAGSTVSLGTTLIIPIDDSVIYVRPLYVSSSQNAYPQLTRYIVVYGNQVEMGTTLGSALAGVFGTVTSTIGGGNGQVPATVRALIASANSYYQQGLAALKNEDLATYSTDMKTVGNLIAQAEADLRKAAKATAPKVSNHPLMKAAKATSSPA